MVGTQAARTCAELPPRAPELVSQSSVVSSPLLTMDQQQDPEGHRDAAHLDLPSQVVTAGAHEGVFSTHQHPQWTGFHLQSQDHVTFSEGAWAPVAEAPRDCDLFKSGFTLSQNA
jgi:hypothetical protein